MTTGMLGAAGQVQGTIVVDLLIVLSIAGLLALVMQRMRLALVPAYLIAGAVIGSKLQLKSVEELTHLAIILLLFGIGLELDVSSLRRGLGRMIQAGLGSCALTVVVGWPVAMAFGLSAPAALAISMAFAISSTAVVLRIIAARRELRRRSGRLCFAILVIQDVLVLAMLALLPALAGWAGPEAAAAGDASAPQNAQPWLWYVGNAAIKVLGVGALVVVGKAILPTILRESLRGGRLEVMMLVGLTAALGAAVATEKIGFSLEMGAFLAGFVLSGTPFRHQLSGQVGPLRDIFSALFFTTIGMKLQPEVLIQGWWVIALSVVILIVLKTTIIAGVCWSLGAMAGTAITVGLSLAQAGEFSLILLAGAGEEGLLSPDVTAVAIAIVVVSLIVTPSLAAIGRWLGRKASGVSHAPWIRSSLFGDEPDEKASPDGDLTHIVIGGFGPIGRRIAEELDRQKVSYTLIELNPDTVKEQLRRRRSVVFGDVANLRVLESAGIGHADALVLTVPDEDAVLRACAVARRRCPGIFIAARIGLVSKSKAASRVGANSVIVDEMATAEAMLRVVLDRLSPAAADEVKVKEQEVTEEAPQAPS